MASLTPNVWNGADIISILMGGSSNKLRTTQEALEELDDFLKALNTYQSTLNSFLDGATSKINSAISSLNPLKAGFYETIETVQSEIENLKGTGIYFLDLNTSVPPMWCFGASFQENKLLSKISSKTYELNSIATKPIKTEDDTRNIYRLTSEIKNLREMKQNLKGNTYGGVGRYAQVFNESLNDTLDRSRPIFNDNASIAAMFIMFGSSSLNDLFTQYDAIKTILQTLKPISTDFDRPLEKLTVTYTSSADYDHDYAIMHTYYSKALKNHRTTSKVHAVLVIRNRESNTVEEEDIIPISFNATEINLVTSLSDGGDSSKYPLYTNPPKSETYYATREVRCILVKSNLVSDNIDSSKIVMDEMGSIYYVTESSLFDSMRSSNTILWDDNASSAATGNSYLYWHYPTQSALISSALNSTYKEFETTVILRKQITAGNNINDLAYIRQTGIPPKNVEGLSIIRKSALGGLRKTYFDSVLDIKEATDQKVFGYEYMVANEYTVYEVFPVLFTPNTEGVLLRFPLYTAVYDTQNSETIAHIASLNAKRRVIIDRLTAESAISSSAKETLDLITLRYSTNRDPYSVGVLKVTFSNIASLTIPIDYDLTQSVPPDWKSFPHLTMIFPQLFKLLDDLVEFLELAKNLVKDVFEYFPLLAKKLKDEAATYLKTVTDLVTRVGNIIRALSQLATGMYVMVTSFQTGGLSAVQKVLAMSLLGSAEDVPWKDNPETYLKFQIGPPPFDQDDYIGGYVLLGGSSSFLVDMFNEYVLNVEEDDINNLEDTFSEDYAKMNATAADNKETPPPYVSDSFDSSTNNAMLVAYLSDALERLESGDTPSLAGDLANSMGGVDGSLNGDYSTAGDAALALKNYDGSAITHPCFLKFIAALRTNRAGLMLEAAKCLKNTLVRLPSDLTLFTNDADANAYNNFKLVLAECISMQLVGIPADNSLRGVAVTIDPFDNVDDIGDDVEQDTYQVGYNIACYYTWDPRTLGVLVINDTLEVVCQNETYENSLYGYYEYEGLVYNDEWEVMLWDS